MPSRLHCKYASRAQYRQYYVDHPDVTSLLARIEAIEARDQTGIPDASPTSTALALFGNPLTSNPAAGESVESQFPTIPPEVLQQIREHSFKPQDLYKLDPLARNSERTKLKVIDYTPISNSTKEYPNFRSLARPLSIYFSILLAY